MWADAINLNRIGCRDIHTYKSTYLNNVGVRRQTRECTKEKEMLNACAYMCVCGTETRSFARSNDKKRKRMLVKKKKEDFFIFIYKKKEEKGEEEEGEEGEGERKRSEERCE